MLRAYIISPVFLLCMVGNLAAQVNDNFSDGNYTVNPTWEGDTSKFDVNAGNELWLNAPAVTDVAFIGTPTSTMINAEWQFYVRMDFNPSSANFCRVYLVSDQKNFNATHLKGYFIELGRVNDEVSLYRQDGTIVTKIIDGPDNMLNLAACTTRVKVTLTGTTWDLQIDSTGGMGFNSVGTIVDATYNQNYWMGAYCKYTSTRSDKFFFDEFIATGTNWNDVLPPQVITHQVNANQLHISLSEMIRTANYYPSNFHLDNGLTVLQVSEDSLNSSQFTIIADAPFVNDVLYHLTIDTMQDIAWNVQTNLVYPFIVHQPVVGEIVLNEVMADPTPVVGLPDAEFIELHNNSIYPINIFKWILDVDGSTDVLPSVQIPAGGFAILTDEGDTALFSGSMIKIPVSTFPSLTNSGASIVLRDSNNTIMDEIHYDLSWYHDGIKDDGGYTIERINPMEFCMQSNNWSASMNALGGTPGLQNSIWDTNQVSIIATASVLDSMHILVVFNQDLDSANIVLSDFTFPNLNAVQVLSTDSCVLVLSIPMPPNTSYTLIIEPTIEDCSGNTNSSDLLINVTYYLPQLFDIIFTELMIDESPAIGLPLAEYIELYNSTPFNISLNGFTLVVNGDAYILGNVVLPADSFIILTDASDVGMFSGILVHGINSFGGLTNESGRVEIYHSNGDLLHAIPYDILFYDNSSKDDGGWSLEMIDRTTPCLWNSNWTASTHSLGGSPGSLNAVNATLTDNGKPHLIRTGVVQPDTVLLYFDEPIHPASFQLGNLVLFDDSVSTIHWQSPLLNTFYMKVWNPLQMDSMYSFEISGITDCEGNVLVSDTSSYAIPHFPSNFDIIINEVLFNPLTGCIDYVELYNRSNIPVDLSQLILGEGDTSSLLVNSYQLLSNSSLILFPGEYIFISEDHGLVQGCYSLADSTHYWDVKGLPDFTNTEGVVGVATYNQQWLDMFAYHDDMHFSVLNSTDGVSLERLDPNAATQNAMNWHSAATTVGYGTPGYKNSQFSPDVIISDQFTVQPEVFSPDNDGYHDYTSIYYSLSTTGYTASVRIYDQAGRLEKVLANNELLGTSGSFVWDGTHDDGGKVNVGIHIILFELVNVNGEVLQFKKPVVVATKL